MSEPMRIAVVGCGAMGSVYAGRLACAGHEVLVVDRKPDHVAAIEDHGLSVSGPDGEMVVGVRAFTTVPRQPVDQVVLAVKASGVAAASSTLSPLIGPDTVVTTIQNGLGSAEIVAAAVDADRLIVGIAKGFGAGLLGPGRVHHNAMQAMRFGAYAGLDRVRLDEMVDAWRVAGFDAEPVDDVRAMQWEKLICNVAYSAPCALTGLTVGEVIDHPEIGPISRAAATEAWTIARARGFARDIDDPVTLVRDFGRRMPQAKPSLLLDHEARRGSEIDVINGAIPREAEAAGLQAPVNATLTGLVRAIESAWAPR